MARVYAIYQIYPRYPMLKAEFTWARNPTKQKVQWFGQTPSGDKLGYMEGFLVQGQPDETAAILDPPVARSWGLHCAGVTSMARTNDPDSADTQFFLMRHPRVGPEGLDQKYNRLGARAYPASRTIQSIKVGPTENRWPLRQPQPG